VSHRVNAAVNDSDLNHSSFSRPFLSNHVSMVDPVGPTETMARKFKQFG
jgi:hypothetical protein